MRCYTTIIVEALGQERKNAAGKSVVKWVKAPVSQARSDPTRIVTDKQTLATVYNNSRCSRDTHIGRDG